METGGRELPEVKTAARWFHKLGSPKFFFEISGRLLPWLWALTAILLATGVVWALGFVPEDYQQGHSVRIMYIHVPAAILAQSGYVMMAAAGLVYLIWRIKLADMALQCAAPVGATLTFLALVTGSIWGKPTWGTWWEWDARLTSTLVLLFLYTGVMALRSAMEGRGAAAGRAAALLAVVGVINLPIIRYSVDWWHTLHQPSSFSLISKPAMPMEMWLPLLVMVPGFYLFFCSTWINRIRTEILHREYRTDWVRELIRSNDV